MNLRSLPIIGLALSAAALLVSPDAAAWYESRDVNGYHLIVTPWQWDLPEDERNHWFIGFTEGEGDDEKPVPAADLTDPTKNKIHAEWLYYGTRDTADNYTKDPLKRLDLGKLQKGLYDDGSVADGVLRSVWMVPTDPGVYGIRLHGLINGAAADELFVCGKATQSSTNAIECVPQRPPTFPGRVEDGYQPNTDGPLVFTPPGEHQVQSADARTAAPSPVPEAIRERVNLLKAHKEAALPKGVRYPNAKPAL
ncbi:MAG: hypothetical protein U1E83_00550 [Methylotetracoccus sp.]